MQTAAFDPIFFLHHANMDRLTALYQQKNPHTWLETTSEPYQRTYVTGPNGYTINSSTPLWPFRCSSLELRHPLHCSRTAWSLSLSLSPQRQMPVPSGGPNGSLSGRSLCAHCLVSCRKAVDTFWTSNDMRDILALGYTYSDFFTGSSNGTMPPAPSPSPAADAGCDDLLHAVVGFQPLGSSLADSKVVLAREAIRAELQC